MTSRQTLFAAALAIPAGLGHMGLTDQDGRRLQPDTLAGKIVVLNFIYTFCSTVCPVQTADLADVQHRVPPALRGRVFFLSVSLDPVRDTPVLLKAFATARGADFSNWSFVTGDPAAIAGLGERLDVLHGGAVAQHGTDIRLFDARGQFRQRYAGKALDEDRLLREIGQLAALP